jgi:succinate--hydroxymethylglutarate CoA-transferase
VRTISEVGTDPHLFERAVVREVDTPARGAVKVLGTPIKLSNAAEPGVTPPPTIGQDTDEVLRRLIGLGDAQIGALRRARVI